MDEQPGNVARRLSTVRNADLIVVMDHGHLVGQRMHHSLPAANSYDGRFCPAQFSTSPGRAGVPEAGL
jgi:ABC-type multidrug transport system fused ATPase/permease subunit